MVPRAIASRLIISNDIRTQLNGQFIRDNLLESQGELQ